MDTIVIKLELRDVPWYAALAYLLIRLGCWMLGFKFEVKHGNGD